LIKRNKDEQIHKMELDDAKSSMEKRALYRYKFKNQEPVRQHQNA
jgi:hypothetical protein